MEFIIAQEKGNVPFAIIPMQRKGKALFEGVISRFALPAIRKLAKSSGWSGKDWHVIRRSCQGDVRPVTMPMLQMIKSF